MKKIIFTLMLLSIIPTTVLAWDDCPQGEVFCEGKCGLFIDTDNDGICDRSQSAPEDRNSGTTNNQATEEEIHDLISGKDLKTNNKQHKKAYHFLLISIFLILLYLISHILSKKKIISIVNHRKIWNIMLLITFLISGLLGILLVIKINFGTVIPLPFNILFWHVEVGIAMFVISIFHILWHWTYFKNLFKIKK